MSNSRSVNSSSCDLHANLPHRKHSINLVELITLEVQLFFHARDVCIVQIGTVEVTSHGVSFRRFRS